MRRLNSPFFLVALTFGIGFLVTSYRFLTPIDGLEREVVRVGMFEVLNAPEPVRVDIPERDQSAFVYHDGEEAYVSVYQLINGDT